ncbi:hypothetical protein Dsin_031389 [Dipteronia sinensis]|uniref:RING-type E3 ubiquitin transferase n=1 Tax=Dipteronia sinensis TaxID=43782 RepID=A0AAD9ZL37_9ROSI|nr:hypothetical protein Dsin_031389 [Dipteronia sinensis]
MVTWGSLGLSSRRRKLGFLVRFVFGLWFAFAVLNPVEGLRPLRDRARSWGDEWLYVRKDENELGPFSPWNITGTYRGSWKFLDSTNSSSKFPDFRKSNGNSVIELVSSPTKITGVHYVQGVIIFHDVFDNEHNVGGAQIRVEGVYIWPFRQLRMVANSGKEGELSQDEDYILSNPYHMLGVFSSQVFQESPREKIWRRKNSPIYEMEKHCNIEIAAQVSRVSSNQHESDRDRYHIEGFMESPAVDDDGDCFSPLQLNATSVNIEVYYNKAVNYTLMVTFVSFLQVLLLIRQMEHSNTQSGAAKVSILMIGQQAIMDAYLCLLHLTAGILVESLFNAFATAAFFKFVVFSIFEMRYLLAIWKASRPMNNGEGWETMRRELSVLYSRFYGILLGGILVMYEFHNFLRPILLLMYSFWIPQIITNVVRDSRKFLHPYYILGISVTRLAIPLYIFGCPHNFMRIEPDKNWCICLCVFIGLQASILLLQHYLGSRWFIPRQVGCTSAYFPYAKSFFFCYLFLRLIIDKKYTNVSHKIAACIKKYHNYLSFKVEHIPLELFPAIADETIFLSVITQCSSCESPVLDLLKSPCLGHKYTSLFASPQSFYLRTVL